MRVFVTVGSTKFDALVEAVLSQNVLEALSARRYEDVVVQCGNSRVEDAILGDARPLHGARIVVYRFKPSLVQDVDVADLVISHAGSGNILDVLRKGKPLIVVPNETLLDNHQKELADALNRMGYLKACAVNDLAQTIAGFDAEALKPFPEFDGSRFRNILDAEMGFPV
ncbi:glycosyltransferase family 1 protein [Peniophora sp. CONT]|nr:glycosyltransferase family 1 protein [Peniophora sp. CONT]